MFQHQTAGEYRIMMGTDVRIQRDPLAMRMREDQNKQSISLLKFSSFLCLVDIFKVFFLLLDDYELLCFIPPKSKEMFYFSTVLCRLQITRKNYIILLEASINNFYIHLRGMSVLQNFLGDIIIPSTDLRVHFFNYCAPGSLGSHLKVTLL